MLQGRRGEGGGGGEGGGQTGPVSVGGLDGVWHRVRPLGGIRVGEEVVVVAGPCLLGGVDCSNVVADGGILHGDAI